ncbi:aldehyde dehydrogenase family protein [Paenibacillus sp. PL2-23]|uniref:aldehyde dehydrogenase family protein n=1 Tax=Paenibacillus sp. PL2-23 TaxID=2100729 RepID=UPI0030F659AF
MISAKLYIQGEWRESESDRRGERYNPAHLEELVGTYEVATIQETEEAVLSASKALKRWKMKAGPERGEYLFKAAQLLEHNGKELACLITSEVGKPFGEAMGEVKRGVALLRYYAGEGMRALGEVYPASDGPSLLYSNRVPLGVVGIITPWNFPVAIPLWKIAPALIYGNTVIWKPAEHSSLTAYRLMQLLEQAGFPPGVIQFVTGIGSEVGHTVINHPSINGISFTGSNHVGKQIAKAAVERGVKYQLEMGGKNPTIVAADAHLEQAAEMTVSAAMRFSGQKCTATSRVIVERAVLEPFTKLLVDKVKGIKVSDPMQADCFLGPVVHPSAQADILSAIQQGVNEGARIRAGGSLSSELSEGCYVNPTVLDHVKPDSDLARKEIFGPVLAIIPADDFQHAIAIANDSQYGLSAAIFTSDIDRMLSFLKHIEAGLIKVNGETAGVEPHAPFGGMKQSSSHSREQGRAAIEFYTSVQTIVISPAGKSLEEAEA